MDESEGINKKIIAGAVVLGIFFIVGIYIFATRDSRDIEDRANEIQSSREQVERELANAREKLREEEEYLASLQGSFQALHPTHSSMFESYRSASSAVNRVDVIVESLPPSLSTTLPQSIVVKKERISDLLSDWYSLVSEVNAGIGEASITDTVNSAEEIQELIEDLLDTLQSVPGDQAEGYIDELEEILQDINEVIEDLGSTSVSPPTPPIQDPVTPQVIEEQEVVVEDAQEEVVQLEEVLEQLEETIPEEESQQEDGGFEPLPLPMEEEFDVSFPPIPDINAQPGIPELIQGTNPY